MLPDRLNSCALQVADLLARQRPQMAHRMKSQYEAYASYRKRGSIHHSCIRSRRYKLVAHRCASLAPARSARVRDLEPWKREKSRTDPKTGGVLSCPPRPFPTRLSTDQSPRRILGRSDTVAMVAAHENGRGHQTYSFLAPDRKNSARPLFCTHFCTADTAGGTPCCAPLP
jgi:hypothetical protein